MQASAVGRNTQGSAAAAMGHLTEVALSLAA